MPKKLYICMCCMVVYLVLFSSCTSKSSDKRATHNTNSATNHTMHNDLWTGCGNCGMESHKFPNWQARIKADGKNYAFCAPRCMWMFLTDSSAKSVDSIIVTDYYSTQKIDARNAFYVTGSSKTSPMGRDFVPFATKQDAQAFMKDYNGKTIYAFGDITKAIVLKEIN